MPIKSILINYVLTFVFFLIIDMAWLGLIAKNLYQKYLDAVKELHAKLSARRTFHTFLQTNNLVAERGKEALELDGDHILNIKSFIVLDEDEYNTFFEKNLKEISAKENVDRVPVIHYEGYTFLSSFHDSNRSHASASSK